MHNRWFNMLDTGDTGASRLIINAQTKTNVHQAVAEKLCPDLTHEQRVVQASKPSSDYLDIIWVKQIKPGFEYSIDIESGVVRFGNGDVYTPDNELHIKEHEWSHNMHGLRRDMICESEAFELPVKRRGPFEIVTVSVNISNRDLDSLSAIRKEYYNRSTINHQLKCTMIRHPVVTLHTCSRKCDVRFDLHTGWIGCSGALIERSDDNQIPGLKHIK